jgi:YidC/Oxa1 family membrane protein insertase
MSGYLNSPDSQAPNGNRLMLVAVIAVGLMLVNQVFFPPPAPPAPTQETASEASGADVVANDEPTEGSAQPGVVGEGSADTIELVEHTLTTGSFEVGITNAGGRIRSVRILAPEQYLPRPSMAAVFPEADDQDLPFGIELGIETWQPDALMQVVSPPDATDHITLQRQLANGLQITRDIRTGELEYTLDATVTLTNQSADRIRLPDVSVLLPGSVRSDTSGGMLGGYGSQLQTICDGEFGTRRRHASKADEPRQNLGPVSFGGINETYFLHALVPGTDGLPASSCTVRGLDEDHAEVSISHGDVTLEPQQSVTLQYRVFAGPKDRSFLEPVSPDLLRSLDFGWFSFLAVPIRSVLLWIQSYVTNWGLAIILLTLMLNVVLLPMRLSMYKNSRKMMEMNKILQPRLKEVEKRFPNDPMKKAEEQQRVMRELGINPLAGCLPMLVPMLIQMPIFFAMFRAILSSTELYNAPFFAWIVDLSQPDPYFVLPLLIGALFFVQQKSMPTPGIDNQQVLVMQRMMPIIFTGLMLFMPAGLVLYSLINTIVAIVQQKALGGGGSAVPPM